MHIYNALAGNAFPHLFAGRPQNFSRESQPAHGGLIQSCGARASIRRN